MKLNRIIARLRIAWQSYQSLDRRGERAAERFVRRRGMKIVGRRERDQFGELDLIAVDGRTIVFIEVKTRRTHGAGHPAEAVDADKQQRLTRLALAYLKRHDLLEYSARFDVVAVTWPDGARKPVIDYYQNAFEAVGRGQMFS
jgi:putative endonuclease